MTDTAPTTNGPRSLGRVHVRREALRVAMDDLERALTAPSPMREQAWYRRVLIALDAVRVALYEHIDVTEGDKGLFSSVLADAPRLHHAVDRLRHQHAEIMGAIDSLADDPAAEMTAAFVAEVRRDGLALVAELSHHRHLGADLVYEAYTVDIAASD
jgi:hypothetical protein